VGSTCRQDANKNFVVPVCCTRISAVHQANAKSFSRPYLRTNRINSRQLKIIYNRLARKKSSKRGKKGSWQTGFAQRRTSSELEEAWSRGWLGFFPDPDQEGCWQKLQVTNPVMAEHVTIYLSWQTHVAALWTICNNFPFLGLIRRVSHNPVR
jgi:hypothetical protein